MTACNAVRLSPDGFFITVLLYIFFYSQTFKKNITIITKININPYTSGSKRGDILKKTSPKYHQLHQNIT